MKMKALYAALSGAILLSAATLAPAADTTKPASTAVKDAAGETAARTKGVASRGTSEVAAATHMDKSAYTAEREKAEADYKAAKKACDPLKGNEQDKCKAEAKYNEQKAKADLEVKYKGTADAAYDAAVKTAKAKHDWDKQKCHDMKGAEQSACKKQASADEKKAIADAKAARSSKVATAPAPASKPATTPAPTPPANKPAASGSTAPSTSSGTSEKSPGK